MMNEIIWIAVFGAGIWGVILLLNRVYDLESRGISVGPGVLMWRTKYGLGILDRISKAWKRFWNFFGFFGGGTGIVLMVLMFVLMIFNTTFLYTRGAPPGTGGAGVKFAIPGITIPFTAGIIGIATVLLVHEPAHGVILRKLGLKTKSTGLALFLVIPGAFVEEDEEEFENSSVSERIQVAGAGPFANIIFGILCLVLILALLNPLPGLQITDTMEDGPAAIVGLPPDSRLIQIGDVEVNDYYDLSSFLDNARPGQRVVLQTEDDEYPIVLGSENGRPLIGITFIAFSSISKSRLLRPSGIYTVAVTEILRNPVINEYNYETFIPWFLIRVLKWIFTLNLLVGLFNLLPLKPLDGGHILEGIVEKFTGGFKADLIVKGFTAATLLILALNIIPTFM